MAAWTQSHWISEGDREECRVTESYGMQQVTNRNLLQEPGYNELRNKREPTSSNLTCRFQNYPIIIDHVPNLSDIPFLYLPFKYLAQRSSPVGSLVHVLDVHKTTDLTTTPPLLKLCPHNYIFSFWGPSSLIYFCSFAGLIKFSAGTHWASSIG